MKPTIIRTNARFRGQTESGKYSNFVGESAHDLVLLAKIMDKDDFIFTYTKGQSDHIVDNMAVYYSGDNQEVTSNIPTAMFMNCITDIIDDTKILSTNWTPYGIATLIDEFTPTKLSLANSVLGKAGISREIDVVEGQRICIRLRVLTTTNGNVPAISIGSSNVNQGEGVMTSFIITEGQHVYIQTSFECRHKERISINIELLEGSGSIEIEMDENIIANMISKKISLQPVNTMVKRRINVLEDQIMNIINNM